MATPRETERDEPKDGAAKKKAAVAAAERVAELRARHADLSHAMQSGVAMEQQYGSQDGSAKHLRTGVNVALRDLGSLTYLLIEKGVLTEEEAWTALVAGMEEEVASYQEKLSKRLGTGVSLG